MGRAPENLTGQRFGRLILLIYLGGNRWLCRCDCGTEKALPAKKIKRGETTSCGCFQRENMSCIKKKHGHAHPETPEYAAWRAMIQRCENEKHRAYKHYGGRGIRVCERWRQDFSAFLADMGERPKGLPRYTLERSNNDGDYEPSNCRWATYSEQIKNRRPTVNRCDN